MEASRMMPAFGHARTPIIRIEIDPSYYMLLMECCYMYGEGAPIYDVVVVT